MRSLDCSEGGTLQRKFMVTWAQITSAFSVWNWGLLEGSRLCWFLQKATTNTLCKVRKILQQTEIILSVVWKAHICGTELQAQQNLLLLLELWVCRLGWNHKKAQKFSAWWLTGEENFQKRMCCCCFRLWHQELMAAEQKLQIFGRFSSIAKAWLASHQLQINFSLKDCAWLCRRDGYSKIKLFQR